MEYKISDLKNFFKYNQREYYIHMKMINFLLRYIEEEEVELVYPKKLFSNDKELEFFAFTSDKIVSIKNENNLLKCKVNNTSDIKSVEIVEEKDDNQYQLNITLYDGTIYEFNNDLDTTKEYIQDYKKLLEEIAQYLIKK